jgi:hypothetical protein
LQDITKTEHRRKLDVWNAYVRKERRVRWCTRVIPAPGTLKQENHELQVSLRNILWPCVKDNERKKREKASSQWPWLYLTKLDRKYESKQSRQ